MLNESAGLPEIFHIEMLNRGMFLPPRGMFVLATCQTEAEIKEILDTFRATLEFIKPYIAAETPHLLLCQS